MCVCLWQSLVFLFMTEFGLPGVTLCGWQDVQIQLLTNYHNTEFCILTGSLPQCWILPSDRLSTSMLNSAFWQALCPSTEFCLLTGSLPQYWILPSDRLSASVLNSAFWQALCLSTEFCLLTGSLPQYWILPSDRLSTSMLNLAFWQALYLSAEFYLLTGSLPQCFILPSDRLSTSMLNSAFWQVFSKRLVLRPPRGPLPELHWLHPHPAAQPQPRGLWSAWQCWHHQRQQGDTAGRPQCQHAAHGGFLHLLLDSHHQCCSVHDGHLRRALICGLWN